ncbi:MAG TPA: glycosyltransferase family 9 protein [Ignavibacteriales bacterium]|nr:glycosyltransferase family 9 protein [Ignavibacteriales bacterium]
MEVLIMTREKILVIQTAFIGDAILTLPMLKRLKEIYPDSTIDVVTTPASSGIFRANPYTYKVYSYDKKGQERSFRSLLRFAREIKKEGYTRLYCPHRSFRSSMLVFLSGVSETYGFSNASIPQVYKNIIYYNSRHHEVKRNIDLVENGRSEADWRILPEVVSGSEEKKKVSEFLKNLEPPEDDKNKPALKLAAVAPGSVWWTKRYPRERFLEIISYLKSRHYLVLLIGGNEDAEYCSGIASEFKDSVVSAAGQFSIVGTIELLRRCSILISNDSAPTHFGMCADIPVLTIYCSTVADFGFYPYNTKSTYVSFDDLTCKPCGIHGRRECPVKTFDCAYKLEMKTITGAVDEIAGGTKTAPQEQSS